MIHRLRPFLVIGMAVATTMTGAAQNPNQKFVQALQGMNSINVASMVYSGTGTAAITLDAKKGPVAAPVDKYTVAINYGMVASRTELERPVTPRRVAQFVADGMAWDVRDKKVAPVPDAVAERIRQIWLTPHGVLKAAQDPASKRQMANETGPDGKPVTTMTFTSGGSLIKATLSDAAMIERVQTMPGDPVLGDRVLDITYADYKDYNGIKFPTHIVQKQAGQTMLDIVVSDVRPNAGLYVEVPPSVAKAAKR